MVETKNRDNSDCTSSLRNKQIQLRRELSTVSAITMEGEEARIVLDEAKQDPLKMFQLLLKGFCPTIIEGRVDMRGEMTSRHSTPEAQKEPLKNKTYRNRRARKYTIETVAEDDCSEAEENLGNRNLHAPQSVPFELKERPPTDVMGNLKAWKAIWDHWCLQNHQHPDDFSLKGFCTVVSDQYHAMLHDNDRVPPGGEECSVGSSASNADDTPQSGKDLSERTMKTIDYAIQEEDDDDIYEEDMPIAEYPSSRRGLEMLVGTILAVLLTFALLQLLGTNNQSKRIQFTLQTKAPRQGILLPELQADTFQ